MQQVPASRDYGLREAEAVVNNPLGLFPGAFATAARISK